MARRLVIPRLSGATASAEGPGSIEPPNVTAIAIAFGVGSGADGVATLDSFTPVYTVELPVFSLGGLDPDGVHEFDAREFLSLLQRRSQRRRWSMRLQLQLQQAADSIGVADIHVQAPFAEGGALELRVAGRTGRGTTTPGGGRSLMLVSTPVHDPAAISELEGSYTVQLSDIDPQTDQAPGVQSSMRTVKLALTRFEFEG